MDLIYLSRAALESCCPDWPTVIEAVKIGMRAVSDGQATTYPTIAMETRKGEGSLFTVRGTIETENLAAIKSVGTYANNRERNFPRDVGLLALHDLKTGVPTAILEGSFITSVRTAAVTTIGAVTLARAGAKVLGCIGTKGIARLAAEMLIGVLELEEVRVHSRNQESRETAARDLEDLGVPTHAVDNWDKCIEGSDIVIDGAGLARSLPLFNGALIEKGAVVISYGEFCSHEAHLLDHIDSVVIDRWDSNPTGALGPLIASGELTEERVDAYMGDIIQGRTEGRKSPSDRILFWHRGLAACDITLGNAITSRAREMAIGVSLPYP